MSDKYCKLNSNYEILIHKIPNDNFNKIKLFYDLSIYFELENIKIKYKNNIISNLNELEKLIFYNKYVDKIYISIV